MEMLNVKLLNPPIIKCNSLLKIIQDRGRPNFGFGFGFGAESGQLITFGRLSVSAESQNLTFGLLSVSAESQKLTFGLLSVSAESSVYFRLRPKVIKLFKGVNFS